MRYEVVEYFTCKSLKLSGMGFLISLSTKFLQMLAVDELSSGVSIFHVFLIIITDFSRNYM